jgi:hypothetical protein
MKQQDQRLLHYSDKSLSPPLKSRVQSNESHYHGIGKPQGFWVSVEGEDDWKSWSTAESYRTDFLAVVSEIGLAPDANILRISNAAELVEFTKTFEVLVYPDQPKLAFWKSIDWEAVAALYQGIIIAPYQWSHRFHDETRWYYSWDCASGCIWDATAIQSITEVSQ